MRPLILAALLAISTAACTTEPELTPQTSAWQMVFDGDYLASKLAIPGALLSVWGSSENDIWMVGGAQEATPTSPATVLNWDGTSWHRLVLPGVNGTFWWVTGLNGELWLAGKDGLVVRWSVANKVFAREQIPSKTQLWGIQAFSGSDVWAVGGEAAACHDNLACGVIWHYDGTAWTAPANLPAGWNTTAWFKVFGRSAKDLFICGMNGHILHWDGSKWSDEVPVAADGSAIAPAKLLTGNCNGNLCVAVGGEATGVIVEHNGSKWTRKAVRSTR